MRILTRRGDADGAWPIIVKMCHLIGQTLDLVRGPVAGVVDYHVMGRGHCALTHVLAHQEEVVPE